METVKLSSKGQLVIPKSLRDNMHLPPGTEFLISLTATGISLTPKTLIFPETTTAQVKGVLAKSGGTLGSDQEIKSRILAKLKSKDQVSKKSQT